MKRNIVALLLVVTLLGAYSCQKSETTAGETTSPTASAEPAPPFKVTTLDGQQLSLESLAGKVILVNFWATWCPPCIAELPALQRLYNQYGAKVDFYFISDEEPQTLKAFLETKGYTIPVYTITDHVKGRLYSRSIPTSFLISPNGRLLMNKTGAAKWDGNKVKNTINYYLKNK